MKKHPELTEKTRKKLINAFWALYKQKDVENIHISEITELAGYHRSTFYEYFTDIYDLLSQEEQSLVQQAQESRDLLKEEGNTMFTSLMDFYQLNAEHVSLLIEHGNMNFVNKLKENIYPMFLSETNLPDNSRNALFFEFGFNGMLMAHDYWYKHQENLSFQELLTDLQDILQSGIVRPLLNGSEK